MSGLGIGFAAGLPLAQKLIRIGAILAIIAALCLTSYCQGRSDGAAGWQLKLEQANRQFLEQKARADALAADQRLTDTIAVNALEKGLRDAIADTPDTAPDAVRIRLGCERLRRAGQDTSRIPACR